MDLSPCLPVKAIAMLTRIVTQICFATSAPVGTTYLDVLGMGPSGLIIACPNKMAYFGC